MKFADRVRALVPSNIDVAWDSSRLRLSQGTKHVEMVVTRAMSSNLHALPLFLQPAIWHLTHE